MTLPEPLRLVFEGRPIPKQSFRAKKWGGGYQTKRIKNEQKRIVELCKQQYRGPLLTGGVRLSFTFIFPLPVNEKKRKRDIVQQGFFLYRIVIPDIDNLIKLVKDAMSGAIYSDDRQVCEYGRVRKVYGRMPGIMVTVESVDEDKMVPFIRNFDFERALKNVRKAGK